MYLLYILCVPLCLLCFQHHKIVRLWHQIGGCLFKACDLMFRNIGICCVWICHSPLDLTAFLQNPAFFRKFWGKNLQDFETPEFSVRENLLLCDGLPRCPRIFRKLDLGSFVRKARWKSFAGGVWAGLGRLTFFRWAFWSRHIDEMQTKMTVVNESTKQTKQPNQLIILFLFFGTPPCLKHTHTAQRCP